MTFDAATISFYTSHSAISAQVSINHLKNIPLVTCGPGKAVSTLSFNTDQSHSLYTLIEKVCSQHENDPKSNKFMRYTGTFAPGRENHVDYAREASQDERVIFGQLFTTAQQLLGEQHGYSLTRDYVTKITLDNTFYLNSGNPLRESYITLNLTKASADELKKVIRNAEIAFYIDKIGQKIFGKRWSNVKPFILDPRHSLRVKLANILTAGFSCLGTSVLIKYRFNSLYGSELFSIRRFFVLGGSAVVGLISFFAIGYFQNRFLPLPTDKQLNGTDATAKTV